MTTLAEIEANDPTFVEDLKRSREAVEKAAEWIKKAGFEVTVKPLRVRPDISQMHEYADEGDLEIKQRIEVKHRNISFTRREDFPYSEVIVDVCHAFDNANPKPYAYVFFNKDLTALAVLYVYHTFCRWSKRKLLDQAKGRVREFYLCPKDLLRWYPPGCEELKP